MIKCARSKPRRRRRGIFLVEILFVLAILSIVMLISGRMFVTDLRVIRSSQAAQDALTRNEQMLRTLRNDVWSAAAVQIGDEGKTLSLRDGAGKQVSWRLEPEQASRTGGDGNSQTWKTQLPLHAEQDPAGVALVWDENSTVGAVRVRLVSQLILSGGSR